MSRLPCTCTIGAKLGTMSQMGALHFTGVGSTIGIGQTASNGCQLGRILFPVVLGAGTLAVAVSLELPPRSAPVLVLFGGFPLGHMTQFSIGRACMGRRWMLAGVLVVGHSLTGRWADFGLQCDPSLQTSWSFIFHPPGPCQWAAL